MAMLWSPQKELSHHGVGAKGISACSKKEFGSVTPVLTPVLTGTGPTPYDCNRSEFDPLLLLSKYSGSRKGRYRLGSKQESLKSARPFCQLLRGFRENCSST